MPADAGIRFGQYVLVRRIARGGMAEVFLAQQRGLEGFDRRVAVKRILPHLADSPDFVKMFLGEAKLAAQLSHPNVVHIYEFGKVEHDYFIAMEFVDGVHAGQLFKHGEKEKMPPALVARIGADAANALHYAHELRAPTGKLYGLVHRDVSPANIMVSFDGVVKLCDFGIAKAAAAGDQLTNPGQVKGKYAYMSPEQTIAAPLDGRSDVFSLAIVLWELLTGRYIVSRGDAVAAMRMIRDGKLDPVDKVAPSVPPPLAKAINWALEPKREKRATAADFAQALEEFIKSSPELANSMQLGGWIRKRFEREGTGQVPAIPVTGAVASANPGTQANPGTLASPSTNATSGSAASAATPPPATPSAYPPRRVVKLLTDTGEGTEIYSASDLDEESAQTLKGARKPAFINAPTMIDRSRRAADEPTMHADHPRRAGIDEATMHAEGPREVGDATEIVRGSAVPADEEDSDNVFETIQQDRRTPVPSGPTVVPTRLQPGLSPNGNLPASPPGPLPSTTPGVGRAGSSPNIGRPGGSGPQVPPSGARAMPVEGRRSTPPPGELARQRRKKMILTAAGLTGLALLSFMIALAASNGSPPARRAEAAKDAASQVAVAPADARLLIAPPPIDAGPTVAVPTIPADAAAGEAYLEVRTIPDGGTVKVGDQSRQAVVQPGDTSGAAIAQLVLNAGTHTVTVEIGGYQPETREVVLEPGEHQRIEIAFTKKTGKNTGDNDHGKPMGRLTVRTTPWSDVYIGSKKLGQAPFADLELAAGTHTLTFKNPSRPTVTKTVKIIAGKSTKLNFNLP